MYVPPPLLFVMYANNLLALGYLQSAILPILSNWTLVALKLLLAIVTAASPNQPPSAGAGGFPPGVPSRMCSALFVM